MTYWYIALYTLPWILAIFGVLFLMYDSNETKNQHFIKLTFYLSYFSFFVGTIIFGSLGQTKLCLICLCMIPISILLLWLGALIYSKKIDKHDRSFNALLKNGIWKKAEIIREEPYESIKSSNKYKNLYTLVLQYEYNGEKKECKTINQYTKKEIDYYKSFKYGIGIKVFDNICKIEEKEQHNSKDYYEYIPEENAPIKEDKKVAYIDKKTTDHISHLLFKTLKILLIVFEVIIPIIISIFLIISFTKN